MSEKLVPVGTGAGTFKGAAKLAGRAGARGRVGGVSGHRRAALTDEQKREAALGYADGRSIRDLATACGVAYGTMHRVLTEAGVTLRGRNGK
jgi:hypothetical protein